MSDKSYKSLLNELDDMVVTRDKYVVIEARANHFLSSGINLINMIRENFDIVESEELIKRLFNSLKNEDVSKFERKIRKLKEDKSNKS